MSYRPVHFSSRVGSVTLNAVAQAEAQAKSRGVALGKLNDSNPTANGLGPALVPGIYDAQPKGPQTARRALAEFLEERGRAESSGEGQEGHAVDPERLYLLSSTSQAYSWLFKLLCDAGDVVLAPKPGYPLIESIGRLENVETLEYQLSFDGSWFMDLSQIEMLLDSEAGSRTRAIVVINPNNPTGSYVKPDERARLVALCAQRGIAIIADEVFFDYTLEPFPGNRRFAGEKEALVFALDGFSKLLAAPHAKVGWIEVSGPDELVEESLCRLDMIADDYLPMSNIIAEQMPELLGAAPSQLARVGGRVHANLATLHTMLDRHESGLVSLLRPEGGWNVLVRFPSTIDETELTLSLIEHHHLTGQPGYFFDMPGNGAMALSLLPEPDVFASNVAALLDAVDAMVL